MPAELYGPGDHQPLALDLSAGDQCKAHLFLVHSHITYLVAKAVLRHEGLEAGRAAFLTSRSFSIDDTSVTRIPISYGLVPRSRRERHGVVRGWKTLRAIDRLLADLTRGQQFHLYTPQTMEFIAQILKSSRLCAGFSFIEEGLYSYCTRPEIERTHPPTRPGLRERLAYRNRIRPARFFGEGHFKAYGVSPKAFPDLERLVVLREVFPAAPPAEAAGIHNVLVFDSLSVHGRVRLESVLAALRRLLKHLRSDGASEVHYKFHPAQVGTEEIPAIESVLAESRIPARRLPDGLSLESLASSRPQVRYYVNLSSVGFYAALLGCPAFSYAEWVAESEPEFTTLMELAPRVFLDSVEFLS